VSKVLLLSPPTPWDSYVVQSELYPNLSIILLGTILNNAGHKAKVVHMLADKVTMPKLQDLILDFEPDIVGITMVTFQAKTSREIMNVIRTVKRQSVRIVIGGPHPSALGNLALSTFPDADIAVIGEGDEAMVRIADGEIKHGILYPQEIQDLDSLPIPNLNLINLKRFSGIYPPGPMPSFNICGSRGCPYNCKFCSRSAMGNHLRFRSPENIIKEIMTLHRKHGIREFFFQDDTFNVNRQWLNELLNLIITYRLNKGIVYRARCRVNEKLIDAKLLKLMRQAGIWEIFYGVENGNQAMLDSMNKGITIAEIKRAFRLTREAGIKTEASFIIGMPGETEKTIKDSLKLWDSIDPDWCSFSRLIPFPGTQVEQELRQKGHLVVDNPEDFVLEKTLVRTDKMSADELEACAVMIGKLVTNDKLMRMLKNPTELVRTAKDMMKSRKSIVKGMSKLWQLAFGVR